VADPGGRECREFDCGGKHEAVVVIGMLADQVDASRRAEDPRGRAPFGCRPAREVIGCGDAARAIDVTGGNGFLPTRLCSNGDNVRTRV
jgi:hypothetical protein